MDLIFHSEDDFSTVTLEMIFILVFHALALVFEIFGVFFYGHPDDDKYNYGLLSKIVVLIGLHTGSSYLICLAADFGVQDFLQGYISGFSMGNYMQVSFLIKEVVCYVVLAYAQYFLDSDNDKGLLRPWSKAIVWTALRMAAVFFIYLIGLIAAATDTREVVECLPLYNGTSDAFTPEYGHQACIPICNIHWKHDPSICLEFATVELPAYVDMQESFVAMNQLFSLIIVTVFMPMGIVWFPYRKWVRLRVLQAPIINDDHELKVARADIAESARALSVVGEALRKRRANFVKQKTRLCHPSWNLKRINLNMDTNRYMRGCYLLFDQYDAMMDRQRKEARSVFAVPCAMLDLILTAAVSVFFIIHFLIFRFMDTYNDVTSALYGKNLFSMIFAASNYIDIFPVTASIYFTFWGLFLATVIGGYRGLSRVLPLWSPMRTTKRARVKMREMLNMTILMLIAMSAIPTLQTTNLHSAADGTWSSRNMSSAFSAHYYRVHSNSALAWLSLILIVVYGVLLFLMPPLKYPFGLSGSDPINTANELSKKWASGVKEPNKFKEKMEKMEQGNAKKAKDLKGGLLMQAAKQTI